MREIDRLDYIKRYEKRLSEFGYDPQTLGWGKEGKQEIRFGILGSLAMREPKSSVLDVGCGFADFYKFLRLHGWKGQYTGIDIVPGLLAEARKQHPDIRLLQADIGSDDFSIENHDYVIASGIMNATLPSGQTEQNIIRNLKQMFRIANKAVCVDFMTTHVDFQKPGAWHTSPAWILGIGYEMTPRVMLRNDYMPYEFSLFLFRNHSINSRNVFEEYESSLNI